MLRASPWGIDNGVNAGGAVGVVSAELLEKSSKPKTASRGAKTSLVVS